MSTTPSRSQLLTLSAAVRAMAALEQLHRVCEAMDLENQDERPTEDEYQAAMAEASAVLKARAPHTKRTAIPS